MSTKTDIPMSVAHATVDEVIDLTPAMRRVVFAGDGLADYPTTGVGDEYVRLIFPDPPDAIPDLPKVVDGNLDYNSIPRDALRTYTIRRHEPGRISVDFVVHDGGVAAAWALQANPGQVLALNTPIGIYDPPEGLEWQVLVADYAGAPAALRIVESTPDVPTRLILEIGSDADRLDVPDHPRCEVTWVTGGNGHGPSRLADIVRALPERAGVGYVWVAGETKELRAVRKLLRHERGLPSSAYKVIGYWTANAEEWRDRFEALDEDTRNALLALWEDEDRDEEEIEDEYEARLAELGL